MFIFKLIGYLFNAAIAVLVIGWCIVFGLDVSKQLAIAKDYETKPRVELVEPHPCHSKLTRGDMVVPAKQAACWISRDLNNWLNGEV